MDQLGLWEPEPRHVEPIVYTFAKCRANYHQGYGLAVVNVHTGETKEYGCPGHYDRQPTRPESCNCHCHREN